MCLYHSRYEVIFKISKCSFHLAFVKKQFRSYGYATFFCLARIKNNRDLNDTVTLTEH